MSDARVERAERLLEDERAALLSGELETLAGIAERKEALLGELQASPPATGALAALRAKAERNGELLAATAKGLRTVIRRVDEIRGAQGPLRTYGSDGLAVTLGSPSGSLEKKA